MAKLTEKVNRWLLNKVDYYSTIHRISYLKTIQTKPWILPPFFNSALPNLLKTP